MRWTKRLIPFLGATALLATSAVPAAAQSEDTPSDLQTRLEEHVGLLNGGMVAVTIRDGEVTTASAGIANDSGDPLTVETPMLLDSPASSLTQAVALSLVDAGLLDLDALVVDYLPDAPVGDGATVRNLLEYRAGTPNIWDELYDEASGIDSLVVDPDRTWTTDDLVAQLDPAEAGVAGEPSSSYADTLLIIQIIEAVTGEDYATAVDEHIVQPLGLVGTVHAAGDVEPPEGRAAGWSGYAADPPVYVTDEWEAARTLRPTYSTAADLAVFLQALVNGRLVSPELLAETMWNEDVEEFAYGLLRSNDEIFPAAGPLGADYFADYGWAPVGSFAFFAVDPSTGDVVVTMSNNWDLGNEAYRLAKSVVQDWALDESAGDTMNEAQMQFRFVGGTFVCDWGQGFPFELPPCEADETQVQMPFEMPFEFTGTFDGSGILTGLQLTNLEERSFTSTARGVWMGEVEGCGYGTVFFTLDDGAGFFGDDAVHYTHGTLEILPGGTLRLAGSVDLVGVQTDHADGTGTVDVTGSYYCDGAEA